MVKTNYKKSIRLKLIIGALILMTAALGFNALLGLNSLEKLYVDSIVSEYNVIGKDLQRTIERSLRFGKDIKNFLGIQTILDKTKLNLMKQIHVGNNKLSPLATSDISVSIAMADKSILYSTDNNSLPKQIFRKIFINDNTKTTENEISFVKLQNKYFLVIPIHKGLKKHITAFIIIKFSETQVKELLTNILHQNIFLIGMILLVGIILLIIFLNYINLDYSVMENFPKKRIFVILFCIIIISQMVFIGINTYKFKNYYLKINIEKTSSILTLLKEDIEYFINKGLPIDKLKKMDVMLEKIISSTPELDNIIIADNNGKALYMADKEGSVDYQENTEASGLNKIKPVPESIYGYVIKVSKKQKDEGFILTTLSKKVLHDKLIAILLDSATVLIISILFFVELMILFFQYIFNHIKTEKKRKKIHYIAIRPVIFLFLFGMDASISFLPLHMENIYEPILGLSKDIIMGLPISVKVFFAAFFVFFGGIWVDKRGWHEPFLAGLLFACIGLIYAWVVQSAIHFIIAMGLVGMGFGLTIIASQGFTISNIDTKKSAQGLSLLFAGAYAGSICGGATGAILAEHIGFPPVFLFSAGIIFFTFVYTIITMNRSFKRPEYIFKEKSQAPGTVPKIQFKQICNFIFNKNILSLVILCSFPAAIAIIGFMNYLCPIYLNRMGASQSTIGRLFMIYGLCLIYLAPYIGKFVDKSGTSKNYIVLSSVLGGLAFIIYQYFGNIAAVATSILLLGLSASCGGAPRRSYILKLSISQELGIGKAMGIFNSMTRVGQVLGPIIFGWLVLELGINNGLTLFGVIYLIASILFFIIAKTDKPESKV